MLQQTRVTTVIPYFQNWILKWPTIDDLAKADHDDVLSAWKGLGYYSRATRLHEGAKVAIAKPSSPFCPVPSKAAELQELPGVGRYTAGAISSIAFGEAEPVLDGNVARVLSRQLGLYADVKDKKISDALWDEADRLIKHVSRVKDTNTSDVPGKWNQAMMELGSTICTPRPRCDECPIQTTCRTFSEGQTLSTRNPIVVQDIEDACTLCDPLDPEDLSIRPGNADEEEPKQPIKKRKGVVTQSNTLSHYFGVKTLKTSPKIDVSEPAMMDSKKRKLPENDVKLDLASITAYCALYPKKVAKKKAAEEECVVCMVEALLPDGSSKWLIEQRPAKGTPSNLSVFSSNTVFQACSHRCGT